MHTHLYISINMIYFLLSQKKIGPPYSSSYHPISLFCLQQNSSKELLIIVCSTCLTILPSVCSTFLPPVAAVKVVSFISNSMLVSTRISHKPALLDFAAFDCSSALRCFLLFLGYHTSPFCLPHQHSFPVSFIGFFVSWPREVSVSQGSGAVLWPLLFSVYTHSRAIPSPHGSK